MKTREKKRGAALWCKRAAALVLALLVIAGLALAACGFREYKDALAREPLSEKVQEIRAGADYTPLDQLPPLYLDAVVAAEDKRFWTHGGVDLIALGRALAADVAALEFAQGGSTITQQLAKNLYFSSEKSLVRKVAEAMMALHIEQALDKRAILELYVNSIYFGDGCYGIRAASLGYYGVEPRQLNAAQCTMLAGLPNAPSVYSLGGDAAQKRQEYVVRQLVRGGYVTEDEAEAILAQAE